MKGLAILIVLAALGYGGYLGYQKWQESRDPLDVGRDAMIDKDYAHAIYYLEQARRLHPSDQSLTLDLAECYFRTGDKSRASKYYTSAEGLLNDPAQAVVLRKHKERLSVLRSTGF